MDDNKQYSANGNPIPPSGGGGAIYHYRWRVLVRWFTPFILRKPKFLAFLHGAASGLEYVHALFLNFKLATEYTLTITGQVCYLEKMLNDRFDYLQRRIYITDGVSYNPLWLALKQEDKPLWLGLKSEQKPLWLPLVSESSFFGSDFIIVVPKGLSYDINEFNARVNKYKLASKQYTIISN